MRLERAELGRLFHLEILKEGQYSRRCCHRSRLRTDSPISYDKSFLDSIVISITCVPFHML